MFDSQPVTAGVALGRAGVTARRAGLRDAERLEKLGVLDRELHHLLDLLHLLVQAADHVERAVGNLLNLHQRDQGVHERREDHVKRVAVVLERDARPRRELRDVHVLAVQQR